MNAATAKARGLIDGEIVTVESQSGAIEGKLKLSQLFHSDAVGISGCYGLGTIHSNPLNRKGPHYNTLVTLADESLDPVSAGVELAPRVRVYRKG